jgi:CRP-like cAMP-binding protein
VEFLDNNYHIDPKHFQVLESIFYEENILFNFLPFRKLYSKGYFGFREIIGGCLRTKTAIAVEECILLKVRKQDYDKYLKEFEEKREQYIVSNMLLNIRTEIVDEILPKLRNIFNSAEIISFDKGEAVIRENDFSNSLYFLISGEVMISKDVKIEVPKKYLSNENKGEFVK